MASKKCKEGKQEKNRKAKKKIKTKEQVMRDWMKEGRKARK